ncbi:MAG: hypothetical protein WAK19_03730, partial [Candidatus Cybelea sp.]
MRSYQLALGVLAGLFAGCAGAGPALQPSITPPNGRLVSHAAAGKSWILPEAKNDDLLYISDLEAQVVDIYTYQH